MAPTAEEKETLKKVRQTLKLNNVLVFPNCTAPAASGAPGASGAASSSFRNEDADSATPRTWHHADVPIPERGVSLAWLVNLATALQQAGVPEEATTQDVVTKLLLPLCRSRAPNPLYPEGTESKAGILQRPSSGTHQSRLGGSFSSPSHSPRGLQRTARTSTSRATASNALNSLRDFGGSCTMKQRDLNAVKQRDADEESEEDEEAEAELSGRCSVPSPKPLFHRCPVKVQPLWELLPPSHCGRSDFYVVHAWQAEFQQLVKHLSCRFNPPAELGQPPPPPVDTSAIFFWLDFAVVPQGELLGQGLQMETAKESMLRARSGVLVMLDPELLLLGRTWTLMEMFVSIYHLPMGRLELIFPNELDLDFAWQMQSKLVGLDVFHSETSRPEDKLCIIRAIKKSVGTKRAAQILQETLMRSVRAALRWGSLERLAVYLSLLIKEREFAMLACVLSSMPELGTDDKALEEIREIFGIYDSDGSGELDIDEFIQVLDAAGFDEEEARKIFDEVNADQGDGVGFGEFEAWWVDSQKQNFMRARRAQKELNFESLCSMMAEFVKLLNRKEFTHYADFFEDWLEKLRSGCVISPKQKLMLPPTKGDMVELADQMSWKLHACDYKGTISALHSFLQNNGDCLDMDVEQVPRDVSSEIEALKTLLKLLDLVLGLLRWYPGKAHHAEHFFVVSERIETKVRAFDGDSTDAEQQQAAARLGKGKKKPSKQINTKGMYGIISNMVHLKYGVDRAMNTELIQEAGTALSRWMASNREGANGKKSGAVASLTQDYLGASNPPPGRSFLPAMNSPRSYGSAGDLGHSPNKVKLPAIPHPLAN